MFNRISPIIFGTQGKKGGQFYTPRSVVELLVEMLEPYKVLTGLGIAKNT
jgi:type I restriction-modification system DNA methylase subunit